MTTKSHGPYGYEIIFRQIQGNTCPGKWTEGGHFYVELHGKYLIDYPSGIAFVTVAEDVDWGDGYAPRLDMVYVLDQHRRNRIATTLVEACVERWPNLFATPPCSEEGEGLAEHLHNSGLRLW